MIIERCLTDREVENKKAGVCGSIAGKSGDKILKHAL